jgi:hypothetical protein
LPNSNEEKREAREDKVNFRSAWRPAGMSRHNQQRSVKEGRSLLGGTHAMKSVKPSKYLFLKVIRLALAWTFPRLI